MLLSLFSFVTALFRRSNRTDEPVDCGPNFDATGKPLRARAGFFPTATFYSSLIVLHRHRGTNSLLCLLKPHWLNTGQNGWNSAAVSGGL